MPNTTNDISLDSARLTDLRWDIEAILDPDHDSVETVRGKIAEVVTGSDFVPEDEQAIVALEMYERIVEVEN